MAAKTSGSAGTRSKILAVLAGGLVLGAGAAITLAAWNDSEFSQGTFTAGSFNLQGSTDGTSFSDHATSPGAGLTFSANYDNLSPDDVVYASYWLQLEGSTTSDATVTPALDSASGDNAPNIAYKVYLTGPSVACQSGVVGTLLFSGSSLSPTVGTDTFDLTKGTTGAAGAAQKLCFVVTAGDQSHLLQSKSATAVWRFTATSN